MKITYELDVKTLSCHIYRDGELIETVPMVGYSARLKELGFDFAAASKKLEQSGGRFGWGQTRSAGIRRAY